MFLVYINRFELLVFDAMPTYVNNDLRRFYGDSTPPYIFWCAYSAEDFIAFLIKLHLTVSDDDRRSIIVPDVCSYKALSLSTSL